MPVSPAGAFAAYPQREAVMNDGGLGFGVQAGGGISVGADGTPSRIAGILLISGGLLAALRLSGFRFNVGVSS